MAVVTDAISTPFSWNAELLKEQGANAHWFGHPIKQLVGEVPTGEQRHGLAILPGSRAQEVRLNLKVISKVLKDWPDPVSFVCAPSYPKTILEPLWTFVSGRRGDVFVEDGKYAVLKASRLAIVCSGTATLEVALCGCPMVVLYKLSLLNHLQGFAMGFKGKSISLPNILLQRDAVPEFKGAAIDIPAFKSEVLRLWDNPDRQLAQLADLSAILGSSQAISDTANLVLSLQ
jgi:lipid-A-disaccharide synthase